MWQQQLGQVIEIVKQVWMKLYITTYTPISAKNADERGRACHARVSHGWLCLVMDGRACKVTLGDEAAGARGKPP